MSTCAARPAYGPPQTAGEGAHRGERFILSQQALNRHRHVAAPAPCCLCRPAAVSHSKSPAGCVAQPDATCRAPRRRGSGTEAPGTTQRVSVTPAPQRLARPAGHTWRVSPSVTASGYLRGGSPTRSPRTRASCDSTVYVVWGVASPGKEGDTVSWLWTWPVATWETQRTVEGGGDRGSRSGLQLGLAGPHPAASHAHAVRRHAGGVQSVRRAVALRQCAAMTCRIRPLVASSLAAQRRHCM